MTFYPPTEKSERKGCRILKGDVLVHACLVMCNIERVGVCVPTLTRDLFHCFSADPEHNSGRGGGPQCDARKCSSCFEQWTNRLRGCDVCCVSVVHVLGAAPLNETEAGGGEKVTSVHLQPPVQGFVL